MDSITPHVLRCGTDGDAPKPVHLSAGPLTMLFEPEHASLRYIRIGDHEILRRIYAAVRNQTWRTIPPRVSQLQVQSGKDSFRVTFAAECRQREIDFVWNGVVTGDAQGNVSFQFEGEAGSTFLRNRIGICVLYPIVECAGKPCIVEHIDGATEAGVFPRQIAPHQPFKNIRAITHDPAPGVRAQVRWEGDVFEMEDQRNWTDASFKVYSTPLEIPFPAPIEKGTRIRQSVLVTLVEQQRKILPVVSGRGAQLSISTTPVLAKPPIGLGSASHGQPLTAREIERLKMLRLSHVRVDLKLSEPRWPSVLRQAAREAGQIGIALHGALFLTDHAEPELAALSRELETVKPRVSLWLIFHVAEKVTGEKWFRLARQRLVSFGTNVLVAAGANTNFVELNRNRPVPDAWALPCYAITPQVHAFDETTLVENLAGQAATLESLRQFCHQAAVISPVTLRPRAAADAAADDGTLPFSVDVRQTSLFGASWTLGSIARLATAGNVHSLTYYETTGWRGIMETEGGSPLPGQFRSRPGAVFPVYHVLASLAGFERICPTHSSHPLQVEGLTVLDARNRRRILAANLLSEPQEIKIKTGTCQAQVRYLDETTAEEALRNPEAFVASPGQIVPSVSGKIELQLLPFAFAQVDVV